MRRRAGLYGVLGGMILVLMATTVSAAPQPAQVHFTAAGDFAQTANTRATLDAIKTSGSDLTLALGDLSYGSTGNEPAWCDYVKSHLGETYPFELISGNHESNGINGNINDFSACLPNQLPGVVGTYGRQYYVDVPATNPLVRYVMISPGLTFPDGTWSYASGTPRYAWTAAAIDGAHTASIPWVVVGMHKPCISVGKYGCDSGADLFNLLLSKKVDLVLSGHDHTYQRSHQLSVRPGCTTFTPGTFNSACVVDTDSSFAAGAGTVSMVVGNSGQLLYNVNADDSETGYFASSSGLNKNPTYGALEVTATDSSFQAAFLRSAGGALSDSFTISRGPQTNTLPVASFTSECTLLSCAFDGTASNDPDGTIASYAWEFGDGTTGTGATPTHSYANPGTYNVLLTVTDNEGATGSTTESVTATAPPTTTTYASDDFARTSSAGWGTAPVGGNWTHGGATSLFTVANGNGTIRTNAGSGPTSSLASVSATNLDLLTRFALDKIPGGSGGYVRTFARQVPGQGAYFAKTRIDSAGGVSVSLERLNSAGTELSVQGASVVSGLTYTSNDLLNVRTQVTGTAPTTIRVKVWKDGLPEPTTWIRSATDSTVALQAPGSVGIRSYLSSAANNAPVTLKLDQLEATAP